MRRPGSRFIAVAAVGIVLATAAAGCGQSWDAGKNESSEASRDAPSAAADDGADDAETAAVSDSAATAVVLLTGVTYQFGGGPSACGEVSGGLIAALPLTQIDGSPAPDDAGMFDLTLYPESLEDQSQISVKLPDGRFGAGYNEWGLDWPAITVERDGLKVAGAQSLTTHTGEQHDATIEVTCG